MGKPSTSTNINYYIIKGQELPHVTDSSPHSTYKIPALFLKEVLEPSSVSITNIHSRQNKLEQ